VTSQPSRKDAVASVRFDAAVIGAVKAAAAAEGRTPGAWIRNAVQREVTRRENGSPAQAQGSCASVMENPSLSFSINAAGQWQVIIADRSLHHSWRYCCESGHASPEEAAAHGSVLAAQLLSAWARTLRPPALGGLLLDGQNVA
jgi:hypothetical protein